MADNQTQQPQFQFPSRNIIITGERVARMTTATVRVSRIDQRIVQMSMGTSPATRDSVRRVSDSYNQAFAQFEAALKEIEKDLDNANRPDKQRRRSESKETRPESRPTLTRDSTKRGANANQQAQPAAPHAASGVPKRQPASQRVNVPKAKPAPGDQAATGAEGKPRNNQNQQGNRQDGAAQSPDASVTTSEQLSQAVSASIGEDLRAATANVAVNPAAAPELLQSI